MNKKANTFEGWITGVIFVVLFVSIFSLIVIPEMNDLHADNHSVAGLPTEDLVISFESFQESSTEKLKDGDLSITEFGELVFKDSWSILIGGALFLMNFLFGSWIGVIMTEYLMLPSIVATILRGIWVISIVYLAISIIFKRRST